ncbi:hypothetical protein ANTPLA_LOCUS7251 [Anthophora plagiata]
MFRNDPASRREEEGNVKRSRRKGKENNAGFCVKPRVYSIVLRFVNFVVQIYTLQSFDNEFHANDPRNISRKHRQGLKFHSLKAFPSLRLADYLEGTGTAEKKREREREREGEKKKRV